MGWGAVAGAAIGVVGGMMASKSQQSAAGKAARASQYAADVQYQMWKDQLELYQPYIDAGEIGLAQIQSLATGKPVTVSTTTPGTTTTTYTTPSQSETTPSQPEVVELPVWTEADLVRKNLGSDLASDYWWVAPDGTPVEKAPDDETVRYSNIAPRPSKITSAEFYESLPPSQMQSIMADYVSPTQAVTTTTTPDVTTTEEYTPAAQQYMDQMGSITQQVQDFQLSQLPPTDLDTPAADWSINPVTGAIEYGETAAGGGIGAAGALLAETPELPGEVDFTFDDTDPIYQFKLSQLQEQINQELSARGLYDSRAGLDVLSDETMQLISQEADTQYERLLNERNFLYQKALDLYSIESQKGQTLYDRLYQQQTDLYNRQVADAEASYQREYQSTLTDDARRIALLQDQYNTAADMYGTNYQTYLDLAKMGAGSASSAGAGSASAAGGMASSLADVGAYQAQGTLLSGQTMANTVTGLGTALSDLIGSQGLTKPSTSNVYGYEPPPV